MIPLSTIGHGNVVALADINTSLPTLRQQLGELGIFPGIQLTVIRNTGRNSSIIIEHHGMELILSKRIASHMMVERT